MGLNLVTAPAEEPLTLTEAKAHLRVDGSSDDTLITTLIGVVREYAEAFTRRALVTQTWDLSLDAFAWPIFLPRPPLQSVTSIQYVDTDGVTQALSASLYTVDAKSEIPRILPAYGESWPSTRCVMNAVTVRFVTGYGAASAVPKEIKQGMLMLLGHLYERRESTIVGAPISSVPMATDWLLWPYRVVQF